MARASGGGTLVGPWAPLAHPLFRYLWLASLGSNVGTWLQNVAAGWEMTNLSPSPLLVALVQVAVTAPGFALALVAGALADIMDRRAILIGAQIGGAIIAGVLALVTASGQLSAPVLLLLTFLLGVQSAMVVPAWTANIADIVPRGQLAPSVPHWAARFSRSPTARSLSRSTAFRSWSCLPCWRGGSACGRSRSWRRKDSYRR